VDRHTGIILAAAASQAYGKAETEVATALLAELQDRPYLAHHPWVYLDRGYRAGHFLADILDLGYLPCVRLQNPEPEPLPTWERRTYRLDWARNRQDKHRIAAARNQVRELVNHRGGSSRQPAFVSSTASLRPSSGVDWIEPEATV